MMIDSISTVLCKSVSKTRQIILTLVVILLILLVTGIVLLIVASQKPCLFTKCHSKALRCINRSPFKAQCICDANTVGNGRIICDECGIKLDPPNARIIGGADVTSHIWPFAVFIRQNYRNVIISDGMSYLISSSWTCGGTLINHKTILTAAHCLKTEGETYDYRSLPFPIVWNHYSPNIESTLEVTVGLFDRRSQTDQRSVKVRQVIRHPLYDEKNLLNDIAIIKLHDYLQPSNTIQFACLEKSHPNVNLTGTVIGFGDTIPGARQGSMILQQVNLTIYPNEFCMNVSPLAIKNWDMQLCCGDLNGERDACHGDSGGGLFLKRNLSDINRYTIEGIVSYGERCATRMKPAIYTRVSNYIDWIREHSDFDV